MSDKGTVQELLCLVNHVFLPPELPQAAPGEREESRINTLLCQTVLSWANAYMAYLSPEEEVQWVPIIEMLEQLLHTTQSPLSQSTLQRDFSQLKENGILALHIRAQNACVVVRRHANEVIFEIFEVSPENEPIMSTNGKLKCSYPTSAVAVPNATFFDDSFLAELSGFLSQMDVDEIDDVTTKTKKAGIKVPETRNTVDPRYITQLLVAILGGLGRAIEVRRVTKRVADEVLWLDAFKPWRRAPLWLIIRVALQTSLEHRYEYKSFMVCLQAGLVDQAIKFGVCSDLLFTMRAKVARRFYKLSEYPTPAFVDVFVEATVKQATQLLQERWATIQKEQALSPPWDPLSCDIENATRLSLPTSYDYIMNALQRSNNVLAASFISQDPGRLCRISDLTLYSEDRLTKNVQDHGVVALHDFEQSVELYIDSWVEHNIHNPLTCKTIASLFEQYHQAAKVEYVSNPEDESIMVLTLTELWVAIDKVSVIQFPLLPDYVPDIPSTFLHPLLFQLSHGIERANIIERYVVKRHDRAKYSTVFSDTTKEESVSTRYFRGSQMLQNLKSKMESCANVERESKRNELTRLRREHSQLLSRSAALDHAYRPLTMRHKKKSCEKCKLKKQAESLTINIHEWPLPAKPLEAERVVFELACPEVFSIWRNVTFSLLCTIGTTDTAVDPANAIHDLHTADIKKWIEQPLAKRITLASTTKQFAHSHYKSCRIPAESSAVLLGHGSQWRLYDRDSQTWAVARFAHVNLSPYGTYVISPKSPYAYFQHTIASTMHSSNQVLAEQGSCPPSLTLHEHIAFGTLRSGGRLQWLNVLRELASNSLSFEREEVHQLFAQATCQLGPFSPDHKNSTREWHDVLTNIDFLAPLLDTLESLLGGVEANWRQVVTVQTIVMIISRVLAYPQSSKEVLGRSYTILLNARQAVYQWVQGLERVVERRTEPEEIQEYSQRLLVIAATCRSTYNIDEVHLPNVLDTVRDLRIFIHCGFLLYHHTPTSQTHMSTEVRRVLARDCRLRHRLQYLVAEKISNSNQGLDDAIQAIWAGFARNDSVCWTPVQTSEKSWWVTRSANSAIVHCNILDGQFLVNGQPLGRLPKSYTSHETYQRIFRDTILDVVPSAEPPMEFTSRYLLYGQQVSFAFYDGQLLIRASRQATDGSVEIFEVIPNSIMFNDLPFSLTQHYVHWLNLGTQLIEFRPLANVWHASDVNLYLDVGSRRLTQGKHSRVETIDVHSSIFKMLSTRLRPLEEAKHMVAFYDLHSKNVRTTFPRSHLTFFLNDNQQLESENTKGYIVDDDQSAGTLFGLKNQLILRKKQLHASRTPEARLVIVPFGAVFSERTDNHIEVHIDTGSLSSVEYHTFTIDDIVGCLSSGSGMKSWFYMLYLHALTSHCLPDPLLKRTGTEEALLALSSARSFSFIELKLDVLEQLAKIATLTPRRHYYPPHLQVMQSTLWNASFHPLTQHDAFSILVSRIFMHMKTLEVFHGGSVVANFELPSSSQSLTLRAWNRSSLYYCRETSGLVEACHDDLYYTDLGKSLQIRRDVLRASYRLSRFSKEDLGTLSYFSSPVWNTILSWSNSRTIHAHPSEKRDPMRTLSYHITWLEGDIESRWLEIYNLCHATDAVPSRWRYQVAFTFPAMVYAKPSMERAAFMFMAFIANFALHSYDRSPRSQLSSVYTLSDGFEPNQGTLRSLLGSDTRQLASTPSGKLCREQAESPGTFLTRRETHWRSKTEGALDHLVNHFVRQWPQVYLQQPAGDVCDWIDITSSTAKARTYFSSCLRNRLLREYFKSLETVLSSKRLITPLEDDSSSFTDFLCRRLAENLDEEHPKSLPPTLRHFLASPPPAELELSPVHSFGSQLRLSSELERMLTQLTSHQRSEIGRLYVEDLHESYQVLKRDGDQRRGEGELGDLLQYENLCAEGCRSMLSEIQDVIRPSTIHGRILLEASQWPRICSRTLLQQLTIESRHTVGSSSLAHHSDWYRFLVSFAERLMEHQRSMRLLGYYLDRRSDEFENERKNTRFDRVEALREPDWLLVQVQGNFLVRQVQAEIASAMINPSSAKNTALQLNMGEGKSSVIVPIIATTLANRKRLVRIIVLKALSKQMFDLLIQRLSYLCNRRVYYIPFSRHLRVGKEETRLLRGLYQQCMDHGGVMVIQPEHILSLKLMVVDRITSKSINPPELELSHSLRDMQAWLAENSRNILDESDEILHVRYQLIYTIGHQEPLQGHSDRWGTIQSVLRLLHQHASDLLPQHSAELEVNPHTNNYPIIRILSPAVSQKLSLLLADDAFNNRIPTVSLAFAPHNLQVMTRRFLTESIIDPSDYGRLRSYFGQTGHWSNVLLLRGLLSGGNGLLHYALSERRWKVDYGHDLRRSRLAVPYRAKDVPSSRAEFGHPDVALVLTCLAYYYAGLTIPQLRLCFNLLYKLDNPTLEYELWVQRGHDVPSSLQRLSGVNLDNAEQFDRVLVPLFRNNPAVADFFLSQIVFPQEAKTFPYKLTATGWDLVEETHGLTTGFSGTNDNRFLLPTSITQYNREEQRGTNARVLSYLLQPENNTYFCLRGRDQQAVTSYEFLAKLSTEYKDVRVLLDVGAQMLQLSNEALASHWLFLRSDIGAAVFFNNEDELMVISQQKKDPEPLHSSPFKTRLDECVVYLDDAHTRGTDLKLPRNARAVVTLGPKVTKDRLVQGCMRMRKLGHGQSVMFCAPPDIDRRIREVEGLSPDVCPQVSHIIKWAILETLSEVQKYIPQWAQQGVDHAQRQEAYVAYSASSSVDVLRDAWRQRESKTLEELYGLNALPSSDTDHPAFQVSLIRDRLLSFGITALSHAGFGEEQEREVSQELEQEREVERPAKVDPVKPSLHPDVKNFVLTGRINTRSHQFIPVVDLLSSSIRCIIQQNWSTGLFVTRGFTQTIMSSGLHLQTLLDFMCPTNWIVSGMGDINNPVFVIFSPHEVNELLPVIQKSRHSMLHMFNPRVTECMRSFSELSFFTMSGMRPRSEPCPSMETQSQLALISGQLYLDNVDMYREVERLLRIRRLDEDGFTYIECDSVILDAFKELVGARRKGMGYRETHVGKILHLRPLGDNDF